MILWFSLSMVGFVYCGYPLCLFLLCKFWPRLTQNRDEYLPTVSLIIAAFNEEKVIADKLNNALGLDYPKDRLNIVVASDGSTDSTNDIVASFKNQGVSLFVVEPRGGKTRALNQVIPQTQSEILLLSDANTMFDSDAIKKLMRHFVDPSVGGVSGDVQLVNAADSFSRSEGLYYQYERWIQELESKVGSIIGADGGMYAVRREVFQAPPNGTIVDDFVISMNAVRQGYRVIYDPEAVATEEGTSTGSEEFRRKIRVVAGGIQALKNGIGLPKVSQPLFLFCYLFHKFFRWILPIFLVLIFIVSGFLVSSGLLYQIGFLIQVACYAMAVGYAYGVFQFDGYPLLRVPYYFCLVNGAALIGIWKGILDTQVVTWDRTTR